MTNNNHVCEENCIANGNVFDDYTRIIYSGINWYIKTSRSVFGPIKACPFCGCKLSTPLEPCRFKSKDDDTCLFNFDSKTKTWRGVELIPSNIDKDIEQLKKDLEAQKADMQWSFNLAVKNHSDIIERLDKLEKGFDNGLITTLYEKITKLETTWYKHNERLDKLEYKNEPWHQPSQNDIDIADLQYRVKKLEDK